MASPQPLVCTSLHLPPDLQPFLRIHEISLHVFLPNLDRLRLALEADRDPEAIKIFFGTRKVSREKIQKAFTVLHLAQEVADEYSKVLEALSERKPTQELLVEVNLEALSGVECSKEAQQAMSAFRRELESAVSRVTTILNSKYKKGSKSSLTSTENTQAISEILSAIDECNELLKQCQNQFAELATHTRDESSVDSNPPSEEETQLMRAKWQTFLDNIRDVWMHGFKVADEILLPTSDNPPGTSERRKSRQKFPSWRTLFQRQDKRELVRSTNALPAPIGPEAAVVTSPNSSPELQTNAINPSNSMEGQVSSGITELVPDATPSNNPPVPKIPFWRRIFRRTNNDNSTPDDGYHQQTRRKRWCF